MTPHTWRVRQITPKPHHHPPPPDTAHEGPYAGRPTLRRLHPATRTWTLGHPAPRPATRIQASHAPYPGKADTP